MQKIFEFTKSEMEIFIKLPDVARALTSSIIFYQMADIGIFIFAYAYIYKSTTSFMAVPLFNLGFYITLPVAYILNGLLLRRFTIRKMMMLGLVGEGIVMFILFFIKELTLIKIFSVGLLLGIPMGLYWSTRLFLFTTEVADNTRDYISGITGSSYSIMRVLIPMAIGWFIATSPSLGFTKDMAYKGVAVLSTLLFILSGLAMGKHASRTIDIKNLWLKRPSKRWQWMRMFVVLGSIQFTVTLALPESLILRYLGHEGIMGTIIAAMNLISGLSLYFFGRFAGKAKRSMILTYSLLPMITASGLLLFTFTKYIIIFYLIALTVFDAFYWYVYFPLLSDQVEEGNRDGDPAKHYPYFIDHEIFINLGRVVTSIIYLWLVKNLANETAITIAVVLAALSQFGILIAGRKLK